jgi:isoquinoline 1-oxidoreductase alpha subunit
MAHEARIAHSLPAWGSRRTAGKSGKGFSSAAAEEAIMAGSQVKGQQRTYDGDPSMPLLWYLRDQLALTGTKYGCRVGLCGACTVHVNGRAVRACTAQMSEIAGTSVTTIEGLHPSDEHVVQVAWRDTGMPQCGYCQLGLMQAAALAKAPTPTDAQILSALAGNLCRCGCHQRIYRVLRAAAGRA